MKKRFINCFVLFIFTIFITSNLMNAQVSPPSLTAPADQAKGVATAPTFTWTAVLNATQYRILISTDSTFTTSNVNQTSATTTFISTNLTNNTTYYWKVCAVVAGVSTAYSPFRTFKVKLQTPALSAPNTGITGAATNVTLVWQSVSGADNYTLDVSTVNDFATTVYSQSNLTTPNQAMSGLLNYTTYYWRVKATTSDGNTSDYAVSRTFQTIQAPPTLTAPANNSLNYPFAKVTFTWGATVNAISYDLQVCKSNLFNTIDLKTYSSIATTSYTPTDYFEYNTQYYWRLRVKVGANNSDYSTVYTFTTGTPSSRISLADANADIVFDHTNGRISQITFKQGSNKQLLNTYLNDKNKTGLGRVSNETNTKLASWVESGTTWVYNYENSLYGSKSLTISWGATGITVDMHLLLDANRNATLSAAWQPGGDNGPIHDNLIYSNASDVPAQINLTYPGTVSSVYSGSTLVTAMFDDRYSPAEFFGYKSSSPVSTTIQQSVACGPSYAYTASASQQTIDLNFAIKSRTNFFTWANKKYIIVKTPAAGDRIPNQSATTVTWDSYGVSGTVDINLSTTGAAPFGTSLTAATANDGTQSVTLPSLTLPQNTCSIQVLGTGASGASGVFTVGPATSTVFSISPALTGSPTSIVSVPITIAPGTGASINAFDIRVIYNKDVLSYVNNTPGAPVTGWVVDATNNSTNGYVQVGGFNSGGAAITASGTVITLTFTIRSTGRVGSTTPLNINNSYLSAADAGALPLNVIGSDGQITLYSRISGRIHYINTLKTAVTGNGIVIFADAENSDSTFTNTSSTGYFDIPNKKPGSVVTVQPKYASVYADTLVAKAVKAGDARAAFDGRDGGSLALTPYQKIAADVNLDGIINSTDALAILQISTGALNPSTFGNSQWVFVDSSYTLNATNWASAPHLKTYSPLDTVRANQSFFAMVAGDVLGDYTPAALQGNVEFNSALTDTAPVQYSVPFMNVRPGDTLSIPLNVRLHGKTVGAFNASIKIDKSLLTYCGTYTPGSSLPINNGWVLSTYFDANGKLNVAGTDFSGSLDPITQDGTLAYFKFIVNPVGRIGDTCQVQLSGVSISDAALLNLPVSVNNGKITVATVTANEKFETPKEYSLSQNYPNPFNPSTTFEYTLPKESRVELTVYNAIGQKVAVLMNNAIQTGKQRIVWNAAKLSSGMYFYTLRAVSVSDSRVFTETKKLILLK